MALIFLKLGGSLITEKTRPYTAREDKIEELAAIIAGVVRSDAGLKIILGHGSGSFGHEAARKYSTREGVSGKTAWEGFAEVWYQASRLNRLVIDALRKARLPAVTISPAASVLAHDGKASTWDIQPLQSALQNGLFPVIHGDVVFDDQRGGTILSTEDLFGFLAKGFKPQRILLAGHEQGVWADFPERQRLFKELTPLDISGKTTGLGGAAGSDVTGGMRSKVIGMLELLEQDLTREVLIFSGEDPQNLVQAMNGANPGTCLHR